MKNKLLFLFITFLFVIPNINAIEVKKADGTLTETKDYNDDYLFAGEDLDFKGKVRDLFFFSDSMAFSGYTEFALSGVAHDVIVDGNVNNGVKAAARIIDIIGNVNGTNFLAGEKVTFGQNSRTVGDTFVGARRLTMLGKHTGNLYAGAAEISIQNSIEGNIHVYTGQLRIHDQGRINGNLTYHSDQEITAEEAARVSGKITFEKKDEGYYKEKFGEVSLFKSLLLPTLFKLSFIIPGLLVLLFPINRFLENRYSGREVLSHSLWGLIPIFVYPSAFVVSILLIITLPLALALLLAFLPILFVTKTLGITMTGSFLAEKLNIKSNNRFIYFLLAVVPYSLLSMIPFFGALLLVFVSSMGCGLVLSKLFNKQLS